MLKVIYANKKTGTVVYDIYLSCTERDVKEYILKFGTAEVEFPQKLVKELPDYEMDLLLYLLQSPFNQKKEFIDCFYIACNKIWEEVTPEQFTLDLKNIAINDES